MNDLTTSAPENKSEGSILLDALRRNPAEIGFPPSLAMDLALKIDTPKNVCAIYGLTKDDFAGIIKHPVFIKAYQEAMEMLKVEGMSFKIKARLQAEAYLSTAFNMAQNPNTSDAVRAKIIENTVRWAGLDAKAADVNAGGNFNIQINLG